ncbi:argininosuccinate lyase [Heyndrickxia sporothermodurans]|uniref:Argininosuccinate lyase n=1 Tax=Heyndrickxia sporothermodurans TaxID=46224 RepID=A0AB37HN78_9BACI|nr:argininosuccinate lyase [Heyndrickxia sporothermodurans]MBL5768424.1 argininosuccinate lyase [Heyndrickxia sporothermodurans]MBL5772073.1 argininosuccinate lyase [Heyndrickxia sporothermodurans]MBL5775664.1 argininosuccinate lyase [Heyndrickxia sporothermodurans]MBL5779184.1 argininosuccinate lyase [Heyndrickxia sporothermodurans]MBL5780673.1 argininosuccinate lyase [Heyndrickxia sporothermodurans]
MNKLDEFIKEEGNVFPGKTYVEELLKPVFNDQRDYLFHVMFDIHRAHVIMLSEQKIISVEEAKVMLDGINKVAKTDTASLCYEPQFEDLFFMMEAKIGDVIGEELAGKIHIARSRNDMGVAMYRLVLREHLLTTLGNSYQLSEALLDLSEMHIETYMTGYTHTQPAQPTTLGHYLLAVYDVLQRDIKRLWSAFETVNQSPLGAAALTTTGFPICRDRTCGLLGFDRVIENSYDSIAGADYILETSTSLMTLMVNTGRWIQDFLQHVTREFGSFIVADPYVQISSIMPQKRNPVSIEHSRSIASSAYGDALAAMNMIHNTPFGDIVDTEDDLQPHLYRAFNNANRVLRLMYAVISTLKVNKEHMAKMARKSSITITELADTLARDFDIPFRKAHSIASHISKVTVKEKKELYDWDSKEINQIIKEYFDVALTEEEWKKIISPEYFVEIRKIQGGPSSDEVTRMIAGRKGLLLNKLKVYERISNQLNAKHKELVEYRL